jgi:hypothetical protein
MTELTTEHLLNYIKDKNYIIKGFDNSPIEDLKQFSPQQQLELFIHNIQHYPQDNVQSLESLFIKNNASLFESYTISSIPSNHYIISDKTLNSIQEKDFLSLIEQCSLNKLYMNGCVVQRCQKMVDQLANNGQSKAAFDLASHYAKISSSVLSQQKLEVNLPFTDKLKQMIKNITPMINPTLNPSLKGTALC